MKRILLILIGLLASTSLWANDESLSGSAGISLESGRFRRGELLHSGTGTEAMAGFGQEDWGVSFWGDRATSGDFAETGLYLRFGSGQYELGFAGYQTNRTNQFSSQADVRLSLHSLPEKKVIYDLSYIQASTPSGQVKWLLATGGISHESSVVDSSLQLTFNGRKDATPNNPAHSVEVQAEISFPGVGQWFFIGGGLSTPLSPEAQKSIQAKSLNGQSNFSEIRLGIGYGF